MCAVTDVALGCGAAAASVWRGGGPLRLLLGRPQGLVHGPRLCEAEGRAVLL